MSNEVKSVCPICGKKFVKRAVNQKYCCIKCKYSAASAERIKLKKGDQFKANGKKFVCVKGGKKPVAKVVKGKAVEKIVLPKNPKIDTIISVKNGNPFKVFFLATLIRERAKREILKNGLMY